MFIVDPTGKRVHTNLTNLKSDLRQFLSVEGEPLSEVDIKNTYKTDNTVLNIMDFRFDKDFIWFW